MKATKLIHIGAFIASLLLASSAAHSKKIFSDYFSGSKGSPNTNKWATEGHSQGRGQFISRGYVNGKGHVNLSVSTYNARNKGKFGQALMVSKRTFGPSNGKKIRIKWRAKINTNQKGIVFGAFLYRQYNQNGKLKSDEIDFEWLTNETAGTSDKVLVSTWRQWDRAAQKYNQNATKYGTHLSQHSNFSKNTNSFRNYEIIWSKSAIRFRIDGKQVHCYCNSKNVPQSKMPIFMNAWVPESSWAEAYNGNFKAVRNRSNNKYHTMAIDYVEIYEEND